MGLNLQQVTVVTDSFSSAKRSQIMSNIRAKDTAPEMQIRKGLHALGFRYRLHDSKLPGKPDLVFPRFESVIFVNGCFWHGHSCHLFRWPTSNEEYWKPKISRTIERDKENLRLLKERGWRILVIWECAFRGRFRFPMENVIEMASDWLVSNRQACELKGYEDVNNEPACALAEKQN
ncbi:MAG: very short patch repair endonuclease [Chloroflexi bacterium]|nr:very short patch repair endonuclease [Chloroflexota bacterium]